MAAKKSEKDPIEQSDNSKASATPEPQASESKPLDATLEQAEKLLGDVGSVLELTGELRSAAEDLTMATQRARVLDTRTVKRIATMLEQAEDATVDALAKRVRQLANETPGTRNMVQNVLAAVCEALSVGEE